jgi:hypothetical protein
MNGIITTAAGNGAAPYSGDGGPATNASLFWPYDVALDSSGSLFIADSMNNRIRQVSAAGLITTVAGKGPSAAFGSYSGEGGAATNANLSSPYSVAVDACGNLLIADQANNRIRKVANTRGPSLFLNNLSSANEGSYQVVVTGPGGSVTSSPARLTVATTPLICPAIRNGDGSVTLDGVNQPGSTRVPLSTTSLSLPFASWQPISTNLVGGNGGWRFVDTNAAGASARFYRSLVEPPAN